MGSERSVKNYNDRSAPSNYNNESDSSNHDVNSNAHPTTYFRDMNLRYFVAEQQTMLNDHAKLLELCLENDNPEAHYIQGLLKYFIEKDEHNGFYHLRQAAKVFGNNANAIYFYGLLKLAREDYQKGKKYLDKLKWRKNISTSDHCWESIKNSLRKIHVPMNMLYYVSTVNLQTRTNAIVNP